MWWSLLTTRFSVGLFFPSKNKIRVQSSPRIRWTNIQNEFVSFWNKISAMLPLPLFSSFNRIHVLQWKFHKIGVTMNTMHKVAISGKRVEFPLQAWLFFIQKEGTNPIFLSASFGSMNSVFKKCNKVQREKSSWRHGLYREHDTFKLQIDSYKVERFVCPEKSFDIQRSSNPREKK